MKAKAKHWVNYNGAWRMAGEEFEIDRADAEEMKRYAEVTDDDTPEQATETEKPDTIRRGRKRKAEE